MTKRTGTKKGEASQRQLLDAAITTMAQGGIESTTIQDIADAAGVSKGVVHYHFASKNDLVLKVLDRSCEAIDARVRETFDAPGTPQERMRRALVELWTVRRDGMPEMRILNELHVLARHNDGLRIALGRAVLTAHEQIREGLERLASAGLKPRVPLDLAPRMVLALLDGLALHHQVLPITADEEAGLGRAIEVVSHALFEVAS